MLQQPIYLIITGLEEFESIERAIYNGLRPSDPNMQFYAKPNRNYADGTKAALHIYSEALPFLSDEQISRTVGELPGNWKIKKGILQTKKQFSAAIDSDMQDRIALQKEYESRISS